MMIKEMPSEEKPRERALKYGITNISNEDLLAILLRSGSKDNSAKDLSIKILCNINSDLKTLNYNSLMKIKGIKQAKALLLLAALEFGRRAYYQIPIQQVKANNPDSIYQYFKSIVNDSKQEHFYALYLDQKKNIISYKELFIGTINMSIVHPREIFKEAYLTSASSIICLHNHPTGYVEPSIEDIELTKKLVEIGKLNAIPIIDHIIIGENKYFSFYENNKL